MYRMQLRAPKALRRRPLRARRVAAAVDAPMEYSPAPRWLTVGPGVLGSVVAVEFVVGLAVLA